MVLGRGLEGEKREGKEYRRVFIFVFFSFFKGVIWWGGKLGEKGWGEMSGLEQLRLEIEVWEERKGGGGLGEDEQLSFVWSMYLCPSPQISNQ